ncbi:MAG: hypothetical protein U9R51_08535 [Actinomycetota bacterium]|nr:hypothetical protein [Actinomycetota bacterium]
MRTISLLVVITTLVVVALVTPGCSDSSGESTTTADSGASASIVVFGRGTVPEVVPDSFPIPDEAVIGATMVDPNRGLTEMIITLPASVDSVVTYYEGNLPLSGYEFTSSEGTGGEWLMEFNGEGADGEIRIKAGGSGVSTATVRLTRS